MTSDTTRDTLIMQHLEKAYDASCRDANGFWFIEGRGDNKLEGAILEAIAILNGRMEDTQ